MFGAPVSVCCVAVRAVLEFFHVCLFPVVPAAVSVMCIVTSRYVINLPQVHATIVVYRDLIGVMMSMQSRAAVLPFIPAVVLLVVLMTAMVIIGAPLLLGIVPKVFVMVPSLSLSRLL